VGEPFPEFAVPAGDATVVERLVKQAAVPFEQTTVNDMVIFTFVDEADFYRVGNLVSAVFDDTITHAIHKAINGPLIPAEAIWASWEDYGFRLPGVPTPEKRERPVPRTLSMDDVLDAYNSAKSITDPGRRERAMKHVQAMRAKLQSS